MNDSDSHRKVVNCPCCEHEIDVGEKEIGALVVCPNCDQVVAVYDIDDLVHPSSHQMCKWVDSLIKHLTIEGIVLS